MWGKETLEKVNNGRPAWITRGRGINRTVIAACHSGSEIDSEGSLYSARNNLEWQGVSGDNSQLWVLYSSIYHVALQYRLLIIYKSSSKTNKLTQRFVLNVSFHASKHIVKYVAFTVVEHMLHMYSNFCLVAQPQHKQRFKVRGW